MKKPEIIIIAAAAASVVVYKEVKNEDYNERVIC